MKWTMKRRQTKRFNSWLHSQLCGQPASSFLKLFWQGHVKSEKNLSNMSNTCPENVRFLCPTCRSSRGRATNDLLSDCLTIRRVQPWDSRKIMYSWFYKLHNNKLIMFLSPVCLDVQFNSSILPASSPRNDDLLTSPPLHHDRTVSKVPDKWL